MFSFTRCKYVGIDISGTAIKMAQENIMDQVKGMDESNLTFIEDDYRQGMRKAKAMFPDECFCIMWMGGSIGNFDRDAAIDFLLEALDVVGPNCLFFLCTGIDYIYMKHICKLNLFFHSTYSAIVIAKFIYIFLLTTLVLVACVTSISFLWTRVTELEFYN